MGNKQLPAQHWGGLTGGAVLEHLVLCLSDARAASNAAPDWRDAVLADLGHLRDVLIAERPAVPRGSTLLRERSHLLSEVGRQRLQVLTSSDLDRLTYELRRLVGEVGAHLGRAQSA